MTGIEPAFSAWEADVLPLNYTREDAHRSVGRGWSSFLGPTAMMGIMSDHDHHPDHDGHRHGHHDHGHHHDQGIGALLRYLRHFPSMWRSPVNDAVVAELALNDHERVADIGAGMGAGVVPAAKTGAMVTAVDPTNYMRAILNARRMWQRARKRIEVVDGSAEQIPIEDGAFDAVMAVNALHHFADVDAAAIEVFRVMAPGGRLIFVDEQFHDPEHPDYAAMDPDHEHIFDPAELAEVMTSLTAAGFEAIDGELLKIDGRPSLRFAARRPL